jgi:hypothetical protein
MTADPAQEFQKIFAALKDYELLLVSDRTFPSVGGLITGSPIKGSWWSHPLAHTIFGVNEVLEDHKDVLITKLIDGKVTFVYRTMWPYIFAVATANEGWQTNDLSIAAKSLFEQLQKKERLNTSKLHQVKGIKLGDVTRELEQRLLVHTEQIHTESGAHAKIVETWSSWADRVGMKDRTVEPEAAKRSLQERVEQLNRKFRAKARLPWQL